MNKELWAIVGVGVALVSLILFVWSGVTQNAQAIGESEARIMQQFVNVHDAIGRLTGDVSNYRVEAVKQQTNFRCAPEKETP